MPKCPYISINYELSRWLQFFFLWQRKIWYFYLRNSYAVSFFVKSYFPLLKKHKKTNFRYFISMFHGYKRQIFGQLHLNLIKNVKSALKTTTEIHRDNKYNIIRQQPAWGYRIYFRQPGKHNSIIFQQTPKIAKN